MQKVLILMLTLLLTKLSFAQTIPNLDSLHRHSDSLAKAGGEMIFTKVDEEAVFPGGPTGWRNYLESNLKGNTPIKKGAPNGTYTVVIDFIVSKNGTISDIKAETHLGYGMEEEVIRIIKKGPKWIPGNQNGKPVNSYRRQPVTFLVTN